MQTYDPGNTLTIRQTTVTNTSDLTTCTGGPDAFDLTWNDGTTSHDEGTCVVLTTGGQLVATSTSTGTSGRFAGKALQEAVAYLAPDLLQCAAPQGVTSGSDPITITVPG